MAIHARHLRNLQPAAGRADLPPAASGPKIEGLPWARASPHPQQSILTGSGNLTQKTAVLFCIGREILDGLVLDRNAHYLAGRLNDLGVRVASIHVLDDVETEIVAALQAALARKPAFLITTGGMGPGKDDLTRASVAKAAGRPLERDERAAEMLGRAYRRLFAMGVVHNQDLNEDRMRMAMLPKGAVPCENPLGTAPAVRLPIGDTMLFLLPGVPEEMRSTFTQHVVPLVTDAGAGTFRESRHIAYPGRDESVVNRVLDEIGHRYPAIQPRAFVQGSEEQIVIRITLLGEHQDRDELHRMLDRAEAELHQQIGRPEQLSFDRDDTD